MAISLNSLEPGGFDLGFIPGSDYTHANADQRLQSAKSGLEGVQSVIVGHLDGTAGTCQAALDGLTSTILQNLDTRLLSVQEQLNRLSRTVTDYLDSEIAGLFARGSLVGTSIPQPSDLGPRAPIKPIPPERGKKPPLRRVPGLPPPFKGLPPLPPLPPIPPAGPPPDICSVCSGPVTLCNYPGTPGCSVYCGGSLPPPDCNVLGTFGSCAEMLASPQWQSCGGNSGIYNPVVSGGKVIQFDMKPPLGIIPPGGIPPQPQPIPPVQFPLPPVQLPVIPPTGPNPPGCPPSVPIFPFNPDNAIFYNCDTKQFGFAPKNCIVATPGNWVKGGDAPQGLGETVDFINYMNGVGWLQATIACESSVPPCPPGSDCGAPPPPPPQPPPSGPPGGGPCPPCEQGPPTVSPPTEPAPQFSQWPSWCNENICSIAASLSPTSPQGKNVRSILENFLGTIPYVGDWLEPALAWTGELYDTLVAGMSCDVALAGPAVALRGALGSIERWAGVPFPELNRTVTYWINYYCQTEIPSVGEVTSLYASNEIDLNTAHCLARANGWCDVWWDHVSHSGRVRPGIPELNSLLLRNEITEEEWKLGLREQGVLDDIDRDRYSVFLRSLPPVGDIVRFAGMGQWNPETIVYFGLSGELPAQLQERLSWYGLNWSARSNAEATAGVPNYTWIDAYWWGHWSLPPLSLAYQAVRRLRADKDSPNGARDPNGIIFTRDDLTRFQQIHAVPPGIRGIELALSYKVIGLRQLNILITNGVIDEQEAAKILEDNGYTHADSSNIAKGYFAQAETKRLKEAWKELQQEFDRGYLAGSVSGQDYFRAATLAGVKAEDVLFHIGVLDARYSANRVDRQVRETRKQFLSGVIDAPRVTGYLSAIGMQPQRISDLLSDWVLVLSGERRTIGAAKAVRYASQGLISLPDLVLRLVNLHYSEQDIAVFLGDLQLLITAARNKQLAQQDRARTATQRANRQAQRDAQNALKALRKELAGKATEAQLLKFYCQGLVGKDEITNKMGFMGYKPDEIDHFLHQCKQAKAARNGKVPKQPKQPKQGRHKGNPPASVPPSG